MMKNVLADLAVSMIHLELFRKFIFPLAVF